MSSEKDSSGQCGWIAFVLFMVFLQAYLPLGISESVSIVNMFENKFTYIAAPELIARVLILIGIVSALLLSAIGAMIFALGLSAAAAKLFAGIKKKLPDRSVFYGKPN